MIYATLVSSIDELIHVHQLNQQNLKGNLSAEEIKEEGFVTWLYSLELLKQMHELLPSVIIKEDDRVIGYALTTPTEASEFHSDLKAMMEHVRSLQYNGKHISSYRFYCMGQICIDKPYRGKGIFELLYKKHKESFSNQYDLLITEISTSNLRSRRAHEKIGFKTISVHTDETDEWNVVVWDWKGP
jgi:hypothetical protein